jgi:hypothetical protein
LARVLGLGDVALAAAPITAGVAVVGLRRVGNLWVLHRTRTMAVLAPCPAPLTVILVVIGTVTVLFVLRGALYGRSTRPWGGAGAGGHRRGL